MQALTIILPWRLPNEYERLNSFQVRFANGQLLVARRGQQLAISPELLACGEHSLPVTGRMRLIEEKNRCAIWLADIDQNRAIREVLTVDHEPFLDAWKMMALGINASLGHWYDDIQPAAMVNTSRKAIEQALATWKLPAFQILPSAELVEGAEP